MTPHERIVSMLRMRASASYKEIALGVSKREERDAIHVALQELLAEGAIEIAVCRTVVSWKDNTIGTRTRYRLAGGAR